MLLHSIPFTTDRDQEIFQQLPAAPGVFLLRGADPASEPYISKTADLRRRIKRLLAPSDGQSKRLNLRERAATIEFTPTGSDFESGLLLYQLVRKTFPDSYTKRLRLNHSPVIRIHWENAYPRAYVTRKLAGHSGKRAEGFSPAAKSVYFGPFRSRAIAERFLNDSLDLFNSRRCTFELDPDPSFPGCVYSEMKMCLAPCFKGCTDEQYIDEVRRVQRFLETCGESLISELEAERDQASAGLEFEAAANLHARIERVKGVVKGCDDIIRRLDDFDALILQPSRAADTVSLFRFTAGQLCGPVAFRAQNLLVSNESSGDSSLYAQPFIAEPTPEPAPVLAQPVQPQTQPGRIKSDYKPMSLEKRLAEAIDEFHFESKSSALTFAEQLALLKRWYYRTSKVGEIFIREPDGSWPFRKMVRGVSRVLASKIAQSEDGPAITQETGEKAPGI